MTKNHLKRIFAPKTWPIFKKEAKFVTRPNPGSCSLENGVPLALLLKEIGVARTTAEAKRILHKKSVLVDQKRVKSPKYLVGFMDVVTLEASKESYRVLIDKKGHLMAHPVKDKESDVKVSKIRDKTIVKGAKIQINLSDGRNILVDKDSYKTGDSLVLKLPEQKIKDHIELKKGAKVFLTGGKHQGAVGTLEDMKDKNSIVKTKDGNIETLNKYVFVIGDGVISLP